MLWLPALSIDGNSRRLPLADASVSALFDVLISDPAETGIARLTAAIERDPALALWSICRAANGGAVGLRTAAALARWLTTCALDILEWPEAEEPGFGEFSPGEDYRRLTIEALETAELARRLAREEPADRGPGEALQEAYLAGLLHGADAWLALDPASCSVPDLMASGGRQPPGSNAEHRNAECGARSAEQQAAQRYQGADAPRSPLPVGRLGKPNAAVSFAREILAGRQPLPPDVAFDREAIAAAANMQGPRDSTESSTRARLLPELARKLARLRQLESRFEERMEAEKLEAMAEFAAGAGHEINNPLAVIAGRAQLFLREERDPERRRELAVMNGQAMRVYEMIADMMLFARPPAPKPSACDISQLLDKLLAELAPEAADRRIELGRVGPRDPLVIQADADQLSVALRALIENAIEAMPNGGRVEVILPQARSENGKAGDDRQEIEIVVRDNGPGISSAVRQHLFDPFYSGRGAGRGLGLGLSKAWRIVTNHGGRIEVESEVGRGATFKVRLPGAAGAEQAVTRP